MQVRVSILFTIAAVVLGGLLAGCSSNEVPDKEAKRAQDRVMIRMSEAEVERDQLKTKLDKSQADLTAAQKHTEDSTAELGLLRKQIADLQQSNITLTSQIEKLKTDLSQAAVKATTDAK